MIRSERRAKTKNIIKKRKQKAQDINPQLDLEEIEEGYFKNNSEMNKYGQGGTAIKTNTRKSHASYRHKGGYGSANNYSPRDKRQIEREKDYD